MVTLQPVATVGPTDQPAQADQGLRLEAAVGDLLVVAPGVGIADDSRQTGDVAGGAGILRQGQGEGGGQPCRTLVGLVPGLARGEPVGH